MKETKTNETHSGVCHRNHRKRLKKRFVEEGLLGFEAHNVLELLLFFAVPQKDTNVLAHTLLEKYDSLSGVFDAEYSDLCRVPGVGENTATLLKLIAPLSRIYLSDKEIRYTKFLTYADVGRYLLKYYIGETREVPLALLLNNRLELIRTVRLDEGGSVNYGNINIRRLVEVCLQYQAAMFVLAHNHPDGDEFPSSEDINTTEEIYDITNSINLRMLDHFIVGRKRYTTVLRPHGGSIDYEDE